MVLLLKQYSVVLFNNLLLILWFFSLTPNPINLFSKTLVLCRITGMLEHLWLENPNSIGTYPERATNDSCNQNNGYCNVIVLLLWVMNIMFHAFEYFSRSKGAVQWLQLLGMLLLWVNIVLFSLVFFSCENSCVIKNVFLLSFITSFWVTEGWG